MNNVITLLAFADRIAKLAEEAPVPPKDPGSPVDFKFFMNRVGDALAGAAGASVGYYGAKAGLKHLAKSGPMNSKLQTALMYGAPPLAGAGAIALAEVLKRHQVNREKGHFREARERYDEKFDKRLEQDPSAKSPATLFFPHGQEPSTL